MRVIVVGAILALFAAKAMAENLVIDDGDVNYIYSNTRGSRQFCNLATIINKVPMSINLTATLMTRDAKKDDFAFSYTVNVYVGREAKNSKWKFQQVTISAGRIISTDFGSVPGFNSDLHAVRLLMRRTRWVRPI